MNMKPERRNWNLVKEYQNYDRLNVTHERLVHPNRPNAV